MRFSAVAGSPPRRMLVGLATALGVLVITSGTVMPAHSADLYYPDRYERPYERPYVRPYVRPYAQPYRYSESYDRPYRYYDEGRPLYRDPIRCDGWRCGTPDHVRHEAVGGPVIERRYIEREYVERRYPGPSRAYYRPHPYADDYDDVPRPPGLINHALPTSYDDE
jgi:hypothetical protein